MDFLIANTFTDSLAQLTNQEQKVVKTKSFDLQLNPANPGFSFHRLDKAKDPDFWSVRVNRDIRLIVHRGESRLLLCYVGHHDDAYDWAARRKIEQHPRTGAAQLVELRETQQEPSAEVAQVAQTVLQSIIPDQITDDELQLYGVPQEWLQACRTANEDTLFDIAERLPQEAAEALIELATGTIPPFPETTPDIIDPFEHPDAKRRFRLMTNSAELAAALDSPWEKWAVFLHPSQQDAVEKKYNGPARVAGSAGTGKTVVALHRAKHLLQQNPDAQVLLTTFSPLLAAALQGKLKQLLGEQPKLAERLSIRSMNQFASDLYAARFRRAMLVDRNMLAEQLRTLLQSEPELDLSANYVLAEWWDVVDAWQLHDWDAYRTVRRLGRKLRIAEARREQMWRVFSALREWMQKQGVMTRNDVYHALTANLAKTENLPCDYVVVDEAQDISVAQLRLLSALAREKDALFFAGDLGQRIFQTPFSWKSLGIDIRGRSKILRINYRTSHQIRRQADQLLPKAISDVDGNDEQRDGAISVFDGPEPLVVEHISEAEEITAVAAWLKQCSADGMPAEELCVIVRSSQQLDRATAAVAAADLESQVLMTETPAARRQVAIATMHAAKGLEFKAIAVMACDDDVLPAQQRLEEADEADLEEVYNTERHLLYVACTRARDRLIVTGVKPISEFCLDILNSD